MKKAIVTLLIGDSITQMFETYARATWEQYAHKHGWDMVFITDFIDHGSLAHARAPHWQKLLILENPKVKEYDAVAWVDADILINFHLAPCMTAGWDPTKIGIASEKDAYWDRPEGRDNVMRRMPVLTGKNVQIPAHYMAAGLPGDVDDFTNTGVLLLNPQLHAPVMRDIYLHYGENANSAKENVPLSYHIFKHKLDFHLDPRFNRCWFYEVVEKYPFLLQSDFRRVNPTAVAMTVNAAWHNSFFLHFTADSIHDGNGEVIALREDMRHIIPQCSEVMSLQLNPSFA